MRARLGRSLTVVGLILLVLGLLLARRVGPGGAPVRLKDGTELRILQVSFGKVHRFSGGPLWQRMLSRMPTNLAAALGIGMRTDLTPIDTLVVWLQWPGNAPLSQFPQRIQVVDSHGLASALTPPAATIQHSNNSMSVSFHLTSFPRREPTLLLQLKAIGGTKLADFRIENPAWKEHAPQQDGPIAATAFVHGERFALLELNTGLQATGTVAASYLNNQWTELIFRIGTNDPARLSTNQFPLGDWSIKSVELRDSFGNYVQERGPQGRIIPLEGERFLTRMDDGIVLIPGAIWPEHVWNIRAEFHRSQTPNLDAAHRWTAAVRLPAEGETLSLQQTGRVENCLIELRSIESRPAAPPLLLLRFVGTSFSHELRVFRVEDQRGTNIVHWFRGRNGAEQRFELRAEPESKELQITFAVLHSVIVQVSGKPTILRTNVARWAGP